MASSPMLPRKRGRDSIPGELDLDLDGGFVRTNGVLHPRGSRRRTGSSSDRHRCVADGSRILQLLAGTSVAASTPISQSRQDLALVPAGSAGQWPREVFIWFFLDRVDRVDTVTQQFDIELVFSACWREPCSENLQVASEDIEWSPSNFKWDPRLKFVNVVAQNSEQTETWYEVCADPDFEILSPAMYLEMLPSAIWVRNFRRIKATFAEKFDCRMFPFDLQLLTMTLTSQLPSDVVLLRFTDRESCADMVADTTHLQDFKFFPPRLIAYDQPGALQSSALLLSKADWSRNSTQYSRLHISPVIVRCAAPYLRSIILPQCILIAVSFAVFLMPPDDFTSRLEVDLDLMLATITFRLIVSDQLPKIAYPTWLGTYCVYSLLFLALVVLENVVARTFEISQTQERPLIAMLLLLWLLMHSHWGYSAVKYLQWRDRYCKTTKLLFERMIRKRLHSAILEDPDEVSVEDLESRLLAISRNRDK